ncbi:hypothetical protein ARMSODRAFT_958625 [Armillaria solidipes]|uniref:Uncharacterized protein n=1 Tax=Armillaria solidipes TaxID=1076256 RepID=A0A2H3BB95_9AGAR|nr:hypothetical protein ARMSODRAFT_958625 [Armillaria solidipes]
MIEVESLAHPEFDEKQSVLNSSEDECFERHRRLFFLPWAVASTVRPEDINNIVS